MPRRRNCCSADLWFQDFFFHDCRLYLKWCCTCSSVWFVCLKTISLYFFFASHRSVTFIFLVNVRFLFRDFRSLFHFFTHEISLHLNKKVSVLFSECNLFKPHPSVRLCKLTSKVFLQVSASSLATKKLCLNTPQCTECRLNMTTVYWGKFKCL